MTRTEERLADALHAAAEAVQRATLRPLTTHDPERLRGADPKGKRQRGWLVPLAAAASVALVAALSIALGGRAGHPPPAGHTRTDLPSYYVVGRTTASDIDGVIEVRDTASGRLRDTHLLPGLGISYLLTATADQRTFFAAGQTNSKVFRFRVTRSGHVVGLGLVTAIPNIGVTTAAAASPDGTKLAEAVLLRSSLRRSAGKPAIMIVDLVTGTHTVWQGGLPRAPHGVVIEEMSWARDGHTLAFLCWAGAAGPRAMRDFSSLYTDVRTVDARMPGGSLSSGHLLYHLRASQSLFIAGAVIAPDGDTIDAVMLRGRLSAGLPQDLTVAEISVRDGRQRLLYAGLRTSPFYGDPRDNAMFPHLRSDGSGHLLLYVDGKLGWIGAGLHPLRLGDVSTESGPPGTSPGDGAESSTDLPPPARYPQIRGSPSRRP